MSAVEREEGPSGSSSSIILFKLSSSACLFAEIRGAGSGDGEGLRGITPAYVN